MNDDELIEAMLVATYDDGCLGAVDSMRAALAVVREHDGRDAERYRWLRAARDGGFWSCHEKDGYGGQVLMSGPDLDAAIDAAMRAEG